MRESMRECMCVCVRECVRECMRMCAYVCGCMCMRACVRECESVFAFVLVLAVVSEVVLGRDSRVLEQGQGPGSWSRTGVQGLLMLAMRD